MIQTASGNFQDISDSNQHMEQLDKDFQLECVPTQEVVQYKSKKIKFLTLVSKYKRQVKQFMQASKLVTITNKTELVDNEKLLKEAMKGIEFPKLKKKIVKYKMFLAAGVPYFGRRESSTPILVTSPRVCVFVIPCTDVFNDTNFKPTFNYFILY